MPTKYETIFAMRIVYENLYTGNAGLRAYYEELRHGILNFLHGL